MDDFNVLIVEDESIIALDIKSAIKKNNYSVCGIASNYDEALKLYSNFNLYIIFMDINLVNSKNGIEIAEEIKKNNPRQIIIFLTSFDDEDIINRASKINPHGYLLKPITRREITVAINLAIEKDKHFDGSVLGAKISLGEDYYYDTLNSILYYRSLPIKLSTQEKKLLIMLVDKKGEIALFLELEEFIWNQEVSKDCLKQLVYRLRLRSSFKLVNSYNTGYKIE